MCRRTKIDFASVVAVKIMTLSIVKAAEARICLDGKDAAIVRARDEQIAMAPGHPIAAAISAGPDVRQITAQLGGEHAAPGGELQAGAGRWDGVSHAAGLPAGGFFSRPGVPDRHASSQRRINNVMQLAHA